MQSIQWLVAKNPDRRTLFRLYTRIACLVPILTLTLVTRVNIHAHTSIEPVYLDGHTYRIPNSLSIQPRGTLIAASNNGETAQFPHATRWTILYHSVNSHDKDTIVSGAIFIPNKKPPAEGWPLISWGHGTTGIADRCAPSQRSNLGYPEYAKEVNMFLASGYAVAATDYIGLGTPGVHTYMNTLDQGNALADIVVAARELAPELSHHWFAVGHSQGGAAAIESTSAGNNRELPEGLAATVALAPGNLPHIELPDTPLNKISVNSIPVLQNTIDRIVTNGSQAASFYMALLGLSMNTTYPDFTLNTIFSTSGLQYVPEILNNACLFDPQSIPPLSLDSFIFRPSTFQRLSEYASPDTIPANGPIMVLQGLDDTDVPAIFTRNMVKKLKSLGAKIDYIELPHIDHDMLLNVNTSQILQYLAQHGGNKTP